MGEKKVARPIKKKKIKKKFGGTKPINKNELWKALNEKSCSPIELDELCEDLYQYLDEYGFAIIILALRQRILQLDRDFLNQNAKNKCI